MKVEFLFAMISISFNPLEEKDDEEKLSKDLHKPLFFSVPGRKNE